MNMFYDNGPKGLISKMYLYLDENFQSNRNPDMTDEQFYYKIRKNAIGPFKKEIYLLDENFKSQMEYLWYMKFKYLFQSLNIQGTKDLVDELIPKFTISPKLEDYLGTVVEQEDVSDLAD